MPVVGGRARETTLGRLTQLCYDEGKSCVQMPTFLAYRETTSLREIRISYHATHLETVLLCCDCGDVLYDGGRLCTASQRSEPEQPLDKHPAAEPAQLYPAEPSKHPGAEPAKLHPAGRVPTEHPDAEPAKLHPADRVPSEQPAAVGFASEQPAAVGFASE